MNDLFIDSIYPGAILGGFNPELISYLRNIIRKNIEKMYIFS
jgi:hypothetical protein